MLALLYIHKENVPVKLILVYFLLRERFDFARLHFKGSILRIFFINGNVCKPSEMGGFCIGEKQMASRAKQICAAPGCTRLTSGKFCEEHQPERVDNRGNASERGYDWRWHKFRNNYLAQPEHQFCALHISPGCTILADCVDHIQPLELGGAKYDPNNLQPACQNCNVAKGRRTIRGTWTFDKDSYSPQG